MAIENSLKFTGNLPTNQPLLYFPPAECILNQDPPSKTSLNGLIIEEYRLTSAECYKQMDVEAFAGLTPAEAREKATRLLIQEDAYYEEINRMLAPFGYAIRDNKVYLGEMPITEALDWVGGAVINQSGTEFYLPIRVWMSGQRYLVSNQNLEEVKFSLFYSSLGYVPTLAFVGDDLYSLAYSEDNGAKPDYSSSLKVLKNDEIIYEMTVFPPNPASGPVRGIYSRDGHWILEVTDMIIQDGEVLNQKLDYSEMFTWRALAGKAFYFYRQAGETHISYDNQTLPLQYENVIHQPMCCSGGMVNMTLGDNGLAFYALRDGFWYYVLLIPEV